MTVKGARARMRGPVRVAANAVLVATSSIVAILFFELSLRIVGYTNPVDFKNPRGGMAPQYYYVPDPISGHDIAKNFSGGVFLLPDYIHTYGAPFPVSSNSLGCRDRPFDSEDSYVLLLGDSFTWGYAALEQTWGATLEQLIGMRVLKCGVGGYGPRHELHKLEKVVTHAGRPRLVIVGYVTNDLLDDYLFPQRTVIDGHMVNKATLADVAQGGRTVRSDEDLQARLKTFLEPKPISFIGRAKDLLAEHLISYNLLRNSEALRRVASRLGFSEPVPPLSDVEVYRSIAEFPWLGQAWEGHLENLRQLNSAVHALGATMLVLIFPDRPQVYDSLRPQEANLQWEYPNQRLAEFFQREQIAFVDLLPDFKRYAHCSGRVVSNVQESLYWAHDGHPSVRGNRLTGLLVARLLLEQSFIQVDDKSKRLADINQLLSAEGRCGFSGASQ